MGKKGEQRLYRIGEAAALLELKTCVLRFWESEFPQLDPVRTPKGQRLYREEDVALLRHIRSLLHEQGMTIEGARRVLTGELTAPVSGDGRNVFPEAVFRSGPDSFSAGNAPGPCSGGARASDPEAGGGLLRDAVAELRALRRLLEECGKDSGRPGEASASRAIDNAAGAASSPEGGVS